MKTLYYNGHIYQGQNLFTDHFLVQDGRIVDSEKAPLERLLSTCEEAIDLQGKTVIAGFNDCHLHLASVGEWMDSLGLMDCRSISDIIQKGKAFLQAEATTFLQGRGWNEDLFDSGEKRPLTKGDLDAISTEIPIVFTRVCGHVATANSKALEILNITPETHIEEGEILKDAKGLPNGLFTENAIKLLNPLYPIIDDALRKKYLKKAMAHALSYGITSVQSNDIMDPSHVPYFKCLKALKAENELPLRYTFQFNFQSPEDLVTYMHTEHKATDYDGIWLSKGTLKLFKDGSLGGRTALMRQPYQDAKDTKGVDALLYDKFHKLCHMAHDHGIQIITHAIGDGAIEACIDMYENLNKGGPNHLRHGIVHCQITDKALLSRIQKNQISIFFQPIFIDYDHKIVHARVGDALASTSYAIGTMLRNGTPLAFSSDAPVESLQPFYNLYCAVTRKGLNSNEPYNPDEAIPLTQAIDAYTYQSAYMEHKESFKGLLKPGYLADFAILSQDIFSLPPEALLETHVLATYVHGEKVYQK